jgi:hypothetical protein
MYNCEVVNERNALRVGADSELLRPDRIINSPRDRGACVADKVPRAYGSGRRRLQLRLPRLLWNARALYLWSCPRRVVWNMATAGGPSAGVSSLPSFVAVINKFAGVPLADIGISSFSVSANKSPEERNTGCPGHGIRTQPLLKAKQGRSSRSRCLVSLLLIFNFFFVFCCFNCRFFLKFQF